ncbi:MAG: mechanosensitive ion channel family protein [Cyclobacteriaceae bacterium]|nr:mechanosensitive ion channel family protein [Cyclobacteriaceae bacterium]
MAQTEDTRFNSPFHAISHHLENMEDGNFEPALAAKVFDPKKWSLEEREDLAIQLIQIYRGAGIVIDLEVLPQDPDYYDSAQMAHRYQISDNYPYIYVEKSGNQWLYSNETATYIGEIHKQIYPLGADKLLTVLPKMGTRKVLGLHLWQHITLLIVILASVIINKIFVMTFKGILFKLLEMKNKGEESKKLVVKVARPLSILILFPLLTLAVPVIQFPMNVTNFIILTLKVLWPFFATLLFYRLVDILGLYLQKMAEKTETTLDDQLVPLVRKTLRIFVVIVGVLAILSNMNVDIWPLLTGLSIGGLAVALAAQDTLKNLFGSIMIFVDKPFQVGDWISSGDIDGTVEEVGFRSTRIRTFRNSLTYVPNGKIADSTIDNHGLRQFRRFYTTITITYDTPPHLVEAFVEGLRKIVAEHPHTRKDVYHVYFNDMAAYSLNIMFYIFFAVPTWGEELKCRHEILLQIMKLAEMLGVQFAFPTQTLHMESFPEKQPNSPVYPDDHNQVQQRMDDFFTEIKNPNQKSN